MTHDFETFTLTRNIATAPETVFRLWSDARLKARWFAEEESPDWSTVSHEGSLEIGGTERMVFEHVEMGRFTLVTHTLIAAPPHRYVYAYRMDAGDMPITASLVTIALSAVEDGTAPTLTEQINFIDGGDTLDTRIPGTEHVLDKLARAAEAFTQEGPHP
ncbi:MAG: SRPBCC domain-containing protein [Pseudomonadota bacterium]